MSSSISRADLEAMSRDELIETVESLQDRVDDLDAETDRLDALVVKAHEKLQTVDDLVDRIDELEDENDRLRSKVDQIDTTKEKVAGIVQFAANKRDGQAVVTLHHEDLQGAYGCSRRYAYQLIDDLPEEYAWILSDDDLRDSQYGSLERDTSQTAKRIGIDFEGIHSPGCPVNQFITRSGGEGHE